MVIGTARITLFLPEVHSLKEKRGIVKSIVKRTQNEFNASVAEIDNLDLWQSAVIGVATVSNDSQHADEMIAKIVQYISNAPHEFEVTDYETEIVHVF